MKESMAVQLSKALAQAELWKFNWNKADEECIAKDKIIEDLRLKHQEAVSSLKTELASALANIARQQGYIDRVLEDDGIEEGKMEEIQRIDRISQPRRHGPPLALYQELQHSHNMGDSSYSRPGGNTAKPKAWFDR